APPPNPCPMSRLPWENRCTPASILGLVWAIPCRQFSESNRTRPTAVNNSFMSSASVLQLKSRRRLVQSRCLEPITGKPCLFVMSRLFTAGLDRQLGNASDSGELDQPLVVRV